MLGKQRETNIIDRNSKLLFVLYYSDALYDPASKVWTRFVEGELKITDKIQQQIMHVGSVRNSNDFYLINMKIF